ncbi:hypothetical protein QE430_001561 [Microbacterium testaceum]|uniref:large exoprotein n=1 Tax=Microbacterium testaceum TaxID=2033 RepID=UPI0027810038|nr:large exoprotein [Microbacterium testaceum]MDQ1173254.1 hypothetical protein [Microbacterium testaceum]
MGDSYYYSDDGSGLAALAFLVVLLPILLLSILAGYLISSFFLMKVFEKAGVEGKWRAWVPIYNVLVAAKLGDLSPWAYLVAAVVSGVLSNIPVIGFIFGLVALAAAVMFGWRLGLKFGKDWPLLLLWLIPGVGFLIWLGILAFGSARWNPNIPPAPWANTILADKTVWNGVPVQPSQQVAGNGGPGAGGSGYGAPGYGTTPPPPARGYTPPPAAGTTPPPPPAGPVV